MKQILLFGLLFCLAPAFSQFNIGIYGAQQIFGAVSSVGREVVHAAQYRQSKKEQQTAEASFMAALQTADSLFVKGKYREAIENYNQALQIREDAYTREQIARSNTELARQNVSDYERLLDRADSAYNGLDYALSIKTYTAALELRNEEYPKAKMERAKAHIERWKTVQFCSLPISDTLIENRSSRAFMPDAYSDFLPEGKYWSIKEYLLASGSGFVGAIAIPANTRLVIYSEPNYKGQILLDIAGPAIIYNGVKKNDPAWMETHSRNFIAPLQAIFPANTRIWSKGDLNQWSNGSMEIRMEKHD